MTRRFFMHTGALLVALSFQASAQSPSARATGDQHRQYVFAPTGQSMPYRVYVPTTWDGKTSLPIILMLHGAGANENSYMDQAGGLLRKLAEQHGYIVVSPLGFTPLGAYGNPLRLPAVFGQEATAAAQRAAVTPAKQRELNLSELEVMTALEVVTEEYGADRSRTFLAGPLDGQRRRVAPGGALSRAMAGGGADVGAVRRSRHVSVRSDQAAADLHDGGNRRHAVARGKPRHVALHARGRLRVRVSRSRWGSWRHGRRSCGRGYSSSSTGSSEAERLEETAMPRSLRVLIVTCGLLLPAAAFAQRGAPADAPPPRTTPRGPYAVTVESYPTLATHTAYHPTDLGAFGPSKLLPIVSWGNGACVRNGSAFAEFLTQIASHGYLAIAIGAKNPPPGTGTALPPTEARPIDDHMLLDAVDWAAKQNADRSSPFYRKIDVSKVAVMGQSCGGLQAIAVSPDPRVTTSVIMNSGVLPATGPVRGATLSNATKDTLTRLHAPIAYIIGGPTDIAYPNAEDDFSRITAVPVFKANLNVGHGGTYRQPGGGWFGEVAVRWLDWRLKGSADAARWFTGSDCRLCTEPVWSVQKKGMK